MGQYARCSQLIKRIVHERELAKENSLACAARVISDWANRQGRSEALDQVVSSIIELVGRLSVDPAKIINIDYLVALY